MSEELIRSLQARISQLTDELAKVNAEAGNRRKASKSVKEELDKATATIASITAERDKLAAAATAAPSEQAATIAELKAQLRTRDHKDAFAAALSGAKDAEGKPLGLHPKATVETLWREAGYTVPDSSPDLARITELIGKAQADHPYLFQAAQESAGTARAGTAPKPPLTAGLGASRGAPDTVPAALYVRKTDLQNPAYALDPVKQKERQAAEKAGLLVVLDE